MNTIFVQGYIFWSVLWMVVNMAGDERDEEVSDASFVSKTVLWGGKKTFVTKKISLTVSTGICIRSCIMLLKVLCDWCFEGEKKIISEST